MPLLRMLSAMGPESQEKLTKNALRTRVLIVEDNPSDADLMEAELRRSGLDFNVQRVMTEEDFIRALQNFAPDVVLSDHSLPTFGAKDAVRIAARERPGTPVLVVTGR